MKVLYHANCPDGFAAAWVVHQAHSGLPERNFIPVQYGQPPPHGQFRKEEDLFIVDFSYSRDEILEMRDTAVVVVIDHHKTAEEELEGLENCIFDMTKSGCVLAWEYFLGNEEVPKLLEYIQDRDLWKFRLPDSRAINAYIGAEEFNFKAFDHFEKWLTDKVLFGDMVRQGDAILWSQKVEYGLAADQAILRDFAGYHVPVVNCAIAGTSEVLHLLLGRHDPDDVPFAVSYCDRADGKRQWGLRSGGEFAVSWVAKVYGGGGHHNSAGFVTDAPDLFDSFLPSDSGAKIKS